jgi:hypothetical protein
MSLHLLILQRVRMNIATYIETCGHPWGHTQKNGQISLLGLFKPLIGSHGLKIILSLNHEGLQIETSFNDFLSKSNYYTNKFKQ